ncbi:class II fructose-bisphosphate aldolase [Streptomyces sp. SID8352]|uniref:class II fructose-bisphosphate aldolase n=1 Tax=Streptomyces sp. SID8352 TaxID=2690338 RepID=UPI00136FF9DE|nr:class II fructose-bisphosphate aldolase [Streptomyces sp. SID8352]MYU21255.1 ketose-bisphosphate aldolase [Streptomyces sp. SID8352]
MTQIDPRRVIQDAVEGGYAVGAFNMHSVETTEALVGAAGQAVAPVFLQVGRAIVPHVGLRKAYEMTRRVAEESDADYVIHLDHGPWEEVFEAIRLGFGSVMYDGAHLPFEENIRTTRRIVEVAHDFGIPVEAELGKIPDADEEVDWSSYYTDVAEAERFVAETGVDFLAISVGIVHGVPLASPQPLDIQRIEEIKAVTGIPLVLHGASGVPEDEVRAAMAAGVHKFNADTDLRHAFRAGIEAVWQQGDRQFEEAVAEGRERMLAATVEKMKLYGCAGQAPSGRIRS